MESEEEQGDVESRAPPLALPCGRPEVLPLGEPRVADGSAHGDGKVPMPPSGDVIVLERRSPPAGYTLLVVRPNPAPDLLEPRRRFFLRVGDSLAALLSRASQNCRQTGDGGAQPDSSTSPVSTYRSTKAPKSDSDRSMAARIASGSVSKECALPAASR